MKKSNTIKMICAIADKVDANGILIPKEVMRNMENENLPVFEEFNNDKQIGTATTKYDDNKGLQVELKINNVDDVKGLKPAISYRVRKSIRENNIEIIQEADIISIGLVLKHADKNIKSI